jgi:hypothetical protein
VEQTWRRLQSTNSPLDTPDGTSTDGLSGTFRRSHELEDEIRKRQEAAVYEIRR